MERLGFAYSGMKMSLDYLEKNNFGVTDPLYGPRSKTDFEFEEVEQVFENVKNQVKQVIRPGYSVKNKVLYTFERKNRTIETTDQPEARMYNLMGFKLEKMESTVFLETSNAVLADMVYREEEEGSLMTPMKPGRIIVETYDCNMKDMDEVLDVFKKEFPEDNFIEENYLFESYNF